jgi:hypothetical protein
MVPSQKLYDTSIQVMSLNGEVSCPLSMGALDHAVGPVFGTLDAGRQKHDVRMG